MSFISGFSSIFDTIKFSQIKNESFTLKQSLCEEYLTRLKIQIPYKNIT